MLVIRQGNGTVDTSACVSRQDASVGRAVVAHFAELTVFLLFCFFLLITRLISDRIELLSFLLPLLITDLKAVTQFEDKTWWFIDLISVQTVISFD